ncbi:MAG: methyl-accepting chemotaxis protein [Clostridiales Family XIII bacterium]|jgi:methyl-accepting chemotaxis protein|nr:methyl-accepting chemotaxis protein [Clostridiales Family XIII bacterium]
MTNGKSFFSKFKAIGIFSGTILLVVIALGLYVIYDIGGGADKLFIISAFSCAVLYAIFLIVVISIYSNLDKTVIRPLNAVIAGIEQVSEGKPPAPTKFKSDDEVGRIAECQRKLVGRMSFDIEFFGHLREGDFTEDLVPTTDGDGLVFSIQAVIENQRTLIRNMKEASGQIAVASTQIANGSYSLAEGSNEQSSAISEFAVTVKELQKSAAANSAKANEVIDTIVEYTKIIKEIGEDMRKMAATMDDITGSAHSISSVSDVIESIAFQTNILALNAAVEAARAGQHGKGFAVVADEVRELSTRSADAARNTSELISADLRNVELGNKIVENATQGMVRIGQLSSGNMERVKTLSQTILEQSNAVNEISQTIDQIAKIVHTNSALAEESAASAAQLSDQAKQLDSLSAHYKIKD